VPVAVAGLVGHQPGHLLHRRLGGEAVVHDFTEQLEDFGGEKRLRADAHHVDAGFAHRVEFADQVVDAGGLGLGAVQRKEGLAFAGVQGEAVGVVHAAELAVVLGQVVVAGGEAARRECQRQAAVGKYLGLHAGGTRCLHVD